MDERLSQYLQEIETAGAYIRSRDDRPVEIGLVLGTGLGLLADEIKQAKILPYSEIPHFPESTVKFHAGRLVMGELAGKSVMAMQGRFHYYEGHSMRAITLPIRVMHRLGIRKLVVTHAAGGMRPHLPPGTMAVIADHINFMGANPLLGPYDERLGERFVDMSEPYSLRMRRLAVTAAQRLGLELPSTVYAAVSGPSFETQAELRMLTHCGADTVGMSVVPEVLTARQLDMEVLGLTVITDQALPDQMISVSHEQVNDVANKIGPNFRRLLKEIIREL
jgi:purine-nucleoside phosphorylase